MYVCNPVTLDSNGKFSLYISIHLYRHCLREFLWYLTFCEKEVHQI